MSRFSSSSDSSIVTAGGRVLEDHHRHHLVTGEQVIDSVTIPLNSGKYGKEEHGKHEHHRSSRDKSERRKHSSESHDKRKHFSTDEPHHKHKGRHSKDSKDKHSRKNSENNNNTSHSHGHGHHHEHNGHQDSSSYDSEYAKKSRRRSLDSDPVDTYDKGVQIRTLKRRHHRTHHIRHYIDKNQLYPVTAPPPPELVSSPDPAPLPPPEIYISVNDEATSVSRVLQPDSRIVRREELEEAALELVPEIIETAASISANDDHIPRSLSDLSVHQGNLEPIEETRLQEVAECPFCGHGKLVNKFTWTGIIAAIICFPCGIYCCFKCRAAVCSQCAARYDQ